MKLKLLIVTCGLFASAATYAGFAGLAPVGRVTSTGDAQPIPNASPDDNKSGTQYHVLPQPSAADAVAANACAMFSATVVASVKDPQAPSWKKSCAEAQDASICKETVKFIIAGGFKTDLQCTGRGASLDKGRAVMVSSL